MVLHILVCVRSRVRPFTSALMAMLRVHPEEASARLPAEAGLRITPVLPDAKTQGRRGVRPLAKGNSGGLQPQS